MKALYKAVAVVAVAAGALVGWNHVTVTAPVAARLAQTPDNSKIGVWAYHQYGVVPSVLVLDMRKADGEASPADAIRVLLQSAQALKDRTYTRVVLAHRGTAKLQLEGEYFQTLGAEYGEQNPVYTMRTLPQNVQRLDGSPAYGTRSGGLFAVVAMQMDDLMTFVKDWYLQELLDELQKKRG